MPTRRSLSVVTADVHERASGVPDALTALGLQVELASLPVGDYRVGPALVERKSMPDLHDSIVRGRLWRQVDKLRRASQYPFFLIEGTRLDDGPIAPSSIRGICLAVIARGIRMIRTEAPGDTAMWLYALATRAGRMRPSDRPAYSQRPRPAAGREAAETLLSAVPGISTVCARALQSHFGNVAGVAAAGPSAWMEVPGIGPDRARALAETLNFRFVEPTRPTASPSELRRRLSN